VKTSQFVPCVCQKLAGEMNETAQRFRRVTATDFLPCPTRGARPLRRASVLHKWLGGCWESRIERPESPTVSSSSLEQYLARARARKISIC
jgi:hypothetical protein